MIWINTLIAFLSVFLILYLNYERYHCEKIHMALYFTNAINFQTTWASLWKTLELAFYRDNEYLNIDFSILPHESILLSFFLFFFSNSLEFPGFTLFINLLFLLAWQVNITRYVLSSPRTFCSTYRKWTTNKILLWPMLRDRQTVKCNEAFVMAFACVACVKRPRVHLAPCV